MIHYHYLFVCPLLPPLCLQECLGSIINQTMQVRRERKCVQGAGEGGTGERARGVHVVKCKNRDGGWEEAPLVS